MAMAGLWGLLQMEAHRNSRVVNPGTGELIGFDTNTAPGKGNWVLRRPLTLPGGTLSLFRTAKLSTSNESAAGERRSHTSTKENKGLAEQSPRARAPGMSLRLHRGAAVARFAFLRLVFFPVREQIIGGELGNVPIELIEDAGLGFVAGSKYIRLEIPSPPGRQQSRVLEDRFPSHFDRDVSEESLEGVRGRILEKYLAIDAVRTSGLDLQARRVGPQSGPDRFPQHVGRDAEGVANFPDGRLDGHAVEPAEKWIGGDRVRDQPQQHGKRPRCAACVNAK